MKWINDAPKYHNHSQLKKKHEPPISIIHISKCQSLNKYQYKKKTKLDVVL